MVLFSLNLLLVKEVKAANPTVTNITTTVRQHNDVTVNYTLNDADDNTPCGIAVTYSIDGLVWAPATLTSGDTLVACTHGGNSHSFIWAANVDLANQIVSAIIKITATDIALESGEGTSSAFTYYHRYIMQTPPYPTGSPQEAKIIANNNNGLEIKFKLVGAEADGLVVFDNTNNDNKEIYREAINASPRYVYTVLYENLLPNKKYTFNLQLYNSSKKGSLYSLGEAYTLAVMPSLAASTDLKNYYVKIDAKNNPPETLYALGFGEEYGQRDGSLGKEADWQTAEFWNNLSILKTENNFFRVKAKNGDGTETDWSETVEAKQLVNLTKEVQCEQKEISPALTADWLGFNLVKAALASSLAVVSTTSNFFLGLFLFSLLVFSVLIIRNFGHKPSWYHFKLLPALAWQKPTDTFTRLALADQAGSWSASYSRHRLYHQAGAASFWGALTSVTVKIVLMFSLSAVIIQGSPSIAQEKNYIDCAGQTVKVGDILTYKITVSFDKDFKGAAKAIISDLVPAGTEFIIGSLSAVGNNVVTSFEPTEKKASAELNSIRGGDVFSVSFKARVREEKEIIIDRAYLALNGAIIETNEVTNIVKREEVKREETVVVPIIEEPVPIIEKPLPAVPATREPAAPDISPREPNEAVLPVTRDSGQPTAKIEVESTDGHQPGGGISQTARIDSASGQINQVEVIEPNKVKAQIIIKGKITGAVANITLLFQSSPIIKTFTPSGESWEYETELILEPGEHTLIVSGKDQEGKDLNQVGPITFNIPSQPLNTPVVFGEVPAAKETLSDFDVLIQDVKGFVDNPLVEKVNKQTVVPVLAVLAVANASTAIPLINLLPYLQYLFTEPLGILGRRRRGWGVIYNSLTKQPVDLAVVRLYDKNTNQLVQTRVTDKNGRYQFIVKEPGKYHITVTKPEYSFPTKILRGKKEDVKYLDLYFGQSIVVKPGGKEGIITVNIPVDPAKQDNSNKKAVGLYLTRRLQNLIASLGILLSAFTCIISPRPLIISLLLLHLIFYCLFRRLAFPFRPKSWGVIYDKSNRHHLAYAVARIYDQQYNRLLESQVADPAGRYSFLVGNNVYYVTAEKEGYQRDKTDLIDLTKHQQGVVGLDIGLKKTNN